MTKPYLILISALGLTASDAFAISRVTKIEFVGKTSPQQILVTGDGPLEYEKVENTADNQVILEVKNAKLANSNVGRRIDTSSFNSKVSLISPYNVEGQDLVRIIVQLRDSATTPAIAVGNRVAMGIDGEPDPNVLAALDASEGAPAPVSTEAPEDPNAHVANYGDASGKGKDGKTAAERLQQVEAARADRKYVGSRITIQVKDAAVADVFRLIGEASGFNIVLGADVTGNITIALVDVPWDLALDTILSTMRLGAERRGNVLRVATLQTLAQEKQLELAAKQAAEKSAPRVTRIIPISYANPQQLIPILQKFGAGSAGGDTGNRDTILLDQRTNSLVIQEVPENIERMAKMIEILDKPTPQVLIESKIIEAKEELIKNIGGSVGASKISSDNFVGVSASGASLTSTSPFPEPANAASNFVSAGFTFARISNMRLRALLSFSESESKSKIISTPRTLVLNRQSANIVQGTPVLVPVTVLDQQTGLPRTSTAVQSANLSLGVTPTVTNDGNVIMDLTISSDTPTPLGENSGIATRNIKTQVVAESGSTLVIGGVYQTNDTEAEGGFPFLRKIPIIGSLFGFDNKTSNRTELLIFVTPKIVNEKELSQGESDAASAAPTSMDAPPADSSALTTEAT